MAAIRTAIQLVDNVTSTARNIANNLEQLSDRFDEIEEAIRSIDGAEIRIESTEAIDNIEDMKSSISDVKEVTETIGDVTEDTGKKVEDVLGDADDALETTETNIEGLGEKVKEVSEDVEGLGEKFEGLGNKTEPLPSSLPDPSPEPLPVPSSEPANIPNKPTSPIPPTVPTSGLSDVLVAYGITDKVLELGAAFLSTADSAAVFETSMAKVASIADTSDVALSDLKNEISSLSTKVGQDANSLAEATYQAISASIDTAEAVDFTESATKLAAGGFTEAATAVDVLTTAINAYGLEAGDATNISDMLITTQNLGKTTVDALANSMGRVIPLASSYSVGLDNLSTAYAELTKNGIATEESTTYLKGMLSELGDTSSEVAVALQEQTGKSFKSLMDAGYSLGDVLNELGNYVDGDTVSFNALWSSQEAGIGALALYNAGAEEFNSVLGKMQDSSGATEKAFETMTDTTEHSRDSMLNSIEVFTTSIGGGLTPALRNLYDAGSGIFDFLNGFVEEFPIAADAVASLTTAAITFGTVLSGLALVTLPMVKDALAALKTVMLTNQYMFVIAGIAAATAAIFTFASAVKSSHKPLEQLTVDSQKQADEIEDLKEQYDNACKSSGKWSDEAVDLQYQIDVLTNNFNENRETLKDLIDEADALIDRTNEINDTYAASTKEIDDETVKALALARKLSSLAESTDLATSSTEDMNDIVNQLNKEFPTLTNEFDGTAESAKKYAESVEMIAKAEAARKKKQSNSAQLTELEYQQELYEETLKKLKANANYQGEIAMQNAIDVGTGSDLEGTTMYSTITPRDTAAYDEIQDKIEAVTESLEANKEKIEELKAENEAMEALYQTAWDSAKSETTETAQATQAAEAAQLQYNDSITAAVDAYNEAYSAAYTSISGQVSLFGEVSAECDKTVDDMIAAWDKQKKYFEDYNTNLQVLRDAGVDESLIQKLSDGTQESASAAAQMASEIQNAGTNADELVSKLNTSFEGVYGENGAITNLAESITSNAPAVKTAMSTALQGMVSAINSQDLNDQVKAGAIANVKSYLAGLTSESAVSQVESGITDTVNNAVTGADVSESENIGKNIVSGITKGIEDNTSDATQASRYLASTTASVFRSTLGIHSPSTVMYQVGAYFVEGLINGLESKKNALIAKVQELAEIVKDIPAGVLEINSPSRVAERIGRFFDMGLINGLGSMMDKVKQASENVGRAVTADAEASFENNYLSDDNADYLRVNNKSKGNDGDKNINISVSMPVNIEKVSDNIDVNSLLKQIEDAVEEALFNSAEGAY